MKQNQQFPVMIADIGGTNARFSLLRDNHTKLQIFEPLKTADYPDIQSAIIDCLARENTSMPRQLLIGAAGLVNRGNRLGECRLTNCNWIIRSREIITDLQLAKVEIMNDFCAQALGVLAIDINQMQEVCRHEPNIDPNSSLKPSGTRLVVGPGTGFGVATILEISNKWIILPSEGATADFGLGTGLNWQRELEIEQHLQKRNGRQTIDNLLSGSGLENIHNAIAELETGKANTTINAAQISSSTDPNAKEAVSLFVSLLGRVSGNLALNFMATGGVFVTGGMACKMLDHIKNGDFRKEFDHKHPHENLTQEIRTFFVNQEFAAIEGLAHYVRHRERFDLSLTSVKISA